MMVSVEGLDEALIKVARRKLVAGESEESVEKYLIESALGRYDASKARLIVVAAKILRSDSNPDSEAVTPRVPKAKPKPKKK